MTDAATSRVLTLVFTDLADSTALKTERGDQAVDELITRHREHVAELADECAGRVIDWAGDGCFLTFDTSSAGVMFALRLQQAHADESDLPAVRIGIHLGEVTEKDGPDNTTYVKGLAVDVAARVQGLAKPGQVLMSSSVYNSAKQRMGVDTLGQPILWQLHGLYDLKGFDHPLEIGEAGLEGVSPLEAPAASEKAFPVALSSKREKVDVEVMPPRGRRNFLVPALIATVIVGGIAFAYWFGRNAAETPTAFDLDTPITSLAILPLDNLMNDPEQDYFADGMTETLTAELAKIKSLRVVSRTSVMRYKSTDLSMPEIAAELGVEGLIEGSVMREGDDVRITVQLIDGRSDTHLWSASYTNTITSVLKLQAEVALAIASEVDAVIAPDEKRRMATRPNVLPEAYDQYLLGELFFDDYTEKGQRDAAAHFKRATELDPNFAEAWAGLGEVYSWNEFNRVTDTVPTARTALIRALELDNTFANAHGNLARITMFYDREWDQAEARYRRAIELAPNGPNAYTNFALNRLIVGKTDEAFALASTGLDLAANDFDTLHFAGWIYLRGNPERAIRLFQQMLDQQPDYTPALEKIMWAHIFSGDYEQAIAIAERHVEVTGGDSFSTSNLIDALSFAGRTDEANQMMEALLQSSEHVADTDIAWSMVFLGRLDEAFAAFERGFEQREWLLVWLATLPYTLGVSESEAMRNLRADPRYRDLVERMGFPPLPAEHPGYADQQAWRAREAAAEEAGAPIEKIAVLPFDDMGADTGEDWFADGMTETLVAQLAKIDGVRVVSRTSAMRYKDSDESIPVIARALGVDALVEGSVQRAGNEVRITAQLIHGVTDEHLWADSYDGTMDNILSLQSEVALAIANEIQVAVAPADANAMRNQRAIAPEAQEAYLKGRFHWNKHTKRGFELAVEEFESAIVLEPDYAAAHAGLADTYSLQAWWGHDDRHTIMPHAKREASRAISVDPNSAEAFTALGAVAWFYEWNWEEAEEHFLRAIELDPDYPTAHHWYGVFLAMVPGRLNDAASESRLAIELDPLSAVITKDLGTVFTYRREYSLAIEQQRRVLDVHPGFAETLVGLSMAYMLNEEYDSAIEYMERYMEVAGRDGMTLPLLAATYAQSNKTDDANRILQEMDDFSPSADKRNWPWIAIAYWHLGDSDEAFRALATAVESRAPVAMSLGTSPLFDPMRGDPRFQAILDQMNFPPLPPDHPVAIMNRERAQQAAP